MKDPKEIEKEKSKKYNNKEIIALSDFEHCLTRPTMYVGSVEKSDERVQIIEGGKIVEKTKTISVGFYKMLNEIVDNAFDEAKRMAGKMPTIIVKINSKTNEVTVIDTGDGFINAEKINQKTGSSNVETAMTMLRAGSNFYNDSASDALIGTNGVGAALVNMLSDSFEITTTNSEVTYQIGWDRFVKKQEECASRKNNPLGTNVKYIPRKDIFKSCKWDKEYLHSMFIFRQYLKNRDSVISNLNLEFYFDDEKLNLDIDFLPENAILLTTKLGIFAAWINFESSASVSFINGANCVGIDRKSVV
jgi:DNA gyrase/topoisomerase IV subunit B